MISCPHALKEVYQSGRLIVFAGAGVSASIEWIDNKGVSHRGPTWREMVDMVAKENGVMLPELLRIRGTDLQILEYFSLKDKTTFQKLTNNLCRHLNPPDEALINSPIHKELASLSHCRLFYTTNYDDFIERSFRALKRSCDVVVCEEDINEKNDCEIIKFHGDWNHPDKMVISERHYERRLNLTDVLDYRFRADLLNKIVLFIGYSFRDPNISYLFRVIQDQTKYFDDTIQDRRAYIAVPDPSDFEIQLFRARKMEVISINSMDPTTDISSLIQELKKP